MRRASGQFGEIDLVRLDGPAGRIRPPGGRRRVHRSGRPGRRWL